MEDEEDEEAEDEEQEELEVGRGENNTINYYNVLEEI